MLGLRHEVEGDPERVRRWGGQDESLRWPGRQVDGDLSRDLELGRGHPGVARTDDPIDGLETRVGQAVGQGADRLRAAGDQQRIDLEETGDTKEDRVVAPCWSAGVATTIRPTPATRAGTTVITSELGYGAEPPGTYAPTLASGSSGVRSRCRLRSRSVSRPGAGSRRTAGRGRWPGRAPGSIVRRGRRERRAALRVSQQPAVRATPTYARVRLTDRLVTAGTYLVEDRAGSARMDGRARRHGARGRAGARPPPGRRQRRRRGRVAGAGRRRPTRARRRCRRRHGTIFSMGRTRMPDAPAALSRGRRPQTSSAPTTEWIAIMPSCASGMTVGDSRPAGGVRAPGAGRPVRSSSGTSARARR